MTFIGRSFELKELNDLYQAQDAKLVVIYGRRRVGKSMLIEQFMADKPHLHFEGLEGVPTAKQIKRVQQELIKSIHIPLLKSVNFRNWDVLFDYLTEYFSTQKHKQVFFLDEFQWLAAGRTKLVSLIKSYWDKYWSKQNVMLILCGSVSSYMTKRVIKSKALYGRINWELCLEPFTPNEVLQLLDGKHSKHEVLLYSMILGGIPKYLTEVNPNQSLEQNLNRLFFTRNGLFVNEYEKIFYSQFFEYKTYETIARKLLEGALSLEEIAYKTKISSGGGLKRYLENLEKAAFISSYIPYSKNLKSKLKKYRLTDEYLRFYFKYVRPNLRLISGNIKRDLFSQMIKPVWQPWLGFAFENFCIKNAIYLAELMGFGDQVIQWGPLYQRSDKRFQIDLVYVRLDKVITVCELKYQDKLIDTSIINEVDRKCRLLTVPQGHTIEKALISKLGPNASLKALNYFHHIITAENFFEN